MKCFIHGDVEAQATCIKCGKAMCVDCSAFSEHQGKCPACRKIDLQNNISRLKTKQKNIHVGSRAGGFIILISLLVFALCIFPEINIFIPISICVALMIIGTSVLSFGQVKTKKQKTAIQRQINYISQQIAKIDEALAKGAKQI